MMTLTVGELDAIGRLKDRLSLGPFAKLILSRNRQDDLTVLVEALDTIYNVTMIENGHANAYQQDTSRYALDEHGHLEVPLRKE